MNCIILGISHDRLIRLNVIKFNNRHGDAPRRGACVSLYDSPVDPWWVILLCEPEHRPFNSFQGRFFDMPKGLKLAPPQQASLNEFWGKPKSTKKVEEPPVASGSGKRREDTDDMHIDESSHRDTKSACSSQS